MCIPLFFRLKNTRDAINKKCDVEVEIVVRQINKG